MPRGCGHEATERSECTDQLQHNLVSNNDDLVWGEGGGRWRGEGEVHQVIR